MRTIHLICNAHIDVIWQWTWDEGFSSALATFKSAADLAEKYDYIFCHNESLLYEEIEKKSPTLFKRIKKLVEQGKWVITGGWYLQPDCLLPSGESFVRQIEVGRNYFYKKFGAKPKVATNFDSFGYSLGLVQILQKCGYKGMLICRPNAVTQFKFPSRFFNWVAPDGSKIIVSNSPSYNSLLGQATIKIVDSIEGGSAGMLGSENNKSTIKKENVDYVLWGVGNHGGGPSAKDLQDISKLHIDGVEIFHSTPENLFGDNIDVKGEVKTSLVPCMPGSYSSMVRVKQSHREAENLFFATEKMLAIAKLSGLHIDFTEWEIAQKKLLTAQFHDILPGTTIAEGETEGLELLAMCKKIVEDYRSTAFLYLTMSEPPAKEGEIPIMVFNYMPYTINTVVEAEFSLADQNWSEDFCFMPIVEKEGEILPCQQIKEGSTLNLDWRKRIIFDAELKPLAITRFNVSLQKTPVKKQPYKQYDLRKLLAKTPLSSPVELELASDTADPWAMSNKELSGLGENPQPFTLMQEKESAKFCGFNGKINAIHTIEDGEILTAVECTYQKDSAKAAVEYKIYKNKPFIDLKVTLEYNEKNKLVRLKIPSPRGVVIGDGPYIVEEKLTDGKEITFQKWLGIKQKDGNIFGVLNDCIYGGSAKDGYLCFTLVRGVGYCVHPIGDRKLYPTDRYLPRIENGRTVYNFRIMTGNVTEISAEAELFNQKPYALSVFPMGDKKGKTQIKTDKKVIMPVLRAKNDSYEMRFYNPDNKPTTFSLTVENEKKTIEIAPYEILTVDYKGEITTRKNIL